MIKGCRRDIDRIADSELSQQGVTQAATDQISSIKQMAAELAAKGNRDLIESMQAATD